MTPEPASVGAGPPARDPRLSEAIEDYAKAIYALSHRGDAAVSTNAVADRLGVTPASASAEGGEEGGVCACLDEEEADAFFFATAAFTTFFAAAALV